MHNAENIRSNFQVSSYTFIYMLRIVMVVKSDAELRIGNIKNSFLISLEEPFHGL